LDTEQIEHHSSRTTAKRVAKTLVTSVEMVCTPTSFSPVWSLLSAGDRPTSIAGVDVRFANKQVGDKVELGGKM